MFNELWTALAYIFYGLKIDVQCFLLARHGMNMNTLNRFCFATFCSVYVWFALSKTWSFKED